MNGTHFTFGRADYVVATITPTTTGRVVITGMDFNYAMGRPTGSVEEPSISTRA